MRCSGIDETALRLYRSGPVQLLAAAKPRWVRTGSFAAPAQSSAACMIARSPCIQCLSLPSRSRRTFHRNGPLPHHASCLRRMRMWFAARGARVLVNRRVPRGASVAILPQDLKVRLALMRAT